MRGEDSVRRFFDGTTRIGFIRSKSGVLSQSAAFVVPEQSQKTSRQFCKQDSWLKGDAMRSFTIGFHAAVIVLSVVFAGCGGGGGGGGGGSSVPTLTYTGNSSAAVITSSNASGIASAVLGGDPSGSVAGRSTSSRLPKQHNFPK